MSLVGSMTQDVYHNPTNIISIYEILIKMLSTIIEISELKNITFISKKYYQEGRKL